LLAPTSGERLVELLQNVVNFARLPRSGDEWLFGLGAAVTAGQNPGDPNMLLMADTAGEALAGQPRVSQLVVGHCSKVAGSTAPEIVSRFDESALPVPEPGAVLQAPRRDLAPLV
jgi:hypothetical protein